MSVCDLHFNQEQDSGPREIAGARTTTQNKYAAAMQVLAEYNAIDDDNKSFYQWLLERA
jgi:hypothetical protein